MPLAIALDEHDRWLGWSAWCAADDWRVLAQGRTEEESKENAQQLLDAHLAVHASGAVDRRRLLLSKDAADPRNRLVVPGRG